MKSAESRKGLQSSPDRRKREVFRDPPEVRSWLYTVILLKYSSFPRLQENSERDKFLKVLIPEDKE